MKAPKRFASASFFVMLFIAIIIAFAVLKVASSVLIPLTIAIMLALVFDPLVSMFSNKLKFPKALSIVIIMLIAVVLIAIVGTILVSSIRTILAQYPKYEERFLVAYETIAAMFKLSFNEELSLISNLWEQAGVRSFVQNFALSFSNQLVTFFKDLMMVFLFTVFFLSEMRFFREKLEFAFADILPSTIRTIISDIMNQIARYVSVKFYISLLTGVLVYVGTLSLRMDFPVMWAFIAFVMNFIPAIGSIISSALTMLFALLQFWPNPVPFFVVTALMIGVNMVLGNVIEPKIQGKSLGLSPFVIIASLSVWGWIWGFAGMVLAIPLMVFVKIVCEHVEVLYPISIMLGTMPAAKEAAKEAAERTHAEEAESAEHEKDTEAENGANTEE